MKLFKVIMTHYAPRGSQSGIVEYLIAETHKDVFDYLHDKSDYTYWKDREWTKEEKTTVTFGHGESALEEDLRDLYYGQTKYNWEQVATNISVEDATTLVLMKIARVV